MPKLKLNVTPREQEMMKLRNFGDSNEKIGQAFSITKERVRQILTRIDKIQLDYWEEFPSEIPQHVIFLGDPYWGICHAKTQIIQRKFPSFRYSKWLSAYAWKDIDALFSPERRFQKSIPLRILEENAKALHLSLEEMVRHLPRGTFFPSYGYIVGEASQCALCPLIILSRYSGFYFSKTDMWEKIVEISGALLHQKPIRKGTLDNIANEFGITVARGEIHFPRNRYDKVAKEICQQLRPYLPRPNVRYTYKQLYEQAFFPVDDHWGLRSFLCRARDMHWVPEDIHVERSHIWREEK